MSKPNLIFTSGDVNALKPDQRDRRFFPMVDGGKVRRPEVIPLAEKLHKEHPEWSAERCLSEAKHRITNRPSGPRRQS